jgi:predicted DsbA family dithiol-disulfide isomerase
MENPLIVADVIEANEFPQLSQRYGVRSVPHTVINNRVQFVGALPESKVVDALRKAASDE